MRSLIRNVSQSSRRAPLRTVNFARKPRSPAAGIGPTFSSGTTTSLITSDTLLKFSTRAYSGQSRARRIRQNPPVSLPFRQSASEFQVHLELRQPLRLCRCRRVLSRSVRSIRSLREIVSLGRVRCCPWSRRPPAGFHAAHSDRVLTGCVLLWRARPSDSISCGAGRQCHKSETRYRVCLPLHTPHSKAQLDRRCIVRESFRRQLALPKSLIVRLPPLEKYRRPPINPTGVAI